LAREAKVTETETEEGVIIVNETYEKVEIAKWRRNERELIQVHLDQYNGRPTICIRAWWRDIDGELRPSKDGINLMIEPHLEKLAAALNDAVAHAKAHGFLKPVED
jgi:hypothetical protein